VVLKRTAVAVLLGEHALGSLLFGGVRCPLQLLGFQ
jgi:hypothetical protein